MIVEDQLDRGAGGIGGIEPLGTEAAVKASPDGHMLHDQSDERGQRDALRQTQLQFCAH
jgi:hypothetical protein